MYDPVIASLEAHLAEEEAFEKSCHTCDICGQAIMDDYLYDLRDLQMGYAHIDCFNDRHQHLFADGTICDWCGEEIECYGYQIGEENVCQECFDAEFKKEFSKES